jgi:hypothetical protein
MHNTYSTALTGQYEGGFGASVPKEVMYPDLIQHFSERGYDPVRHDYLMQRGLKGAPIAQPATQEWVDTVSSYLRSKGVLGSGAADETGATRLATALQAMASGEMPGIRAYHGSPYDFERFDLSKIGTGEGAQAYGHGLYFAENPSVAEQYKKALTGLNPNQLGSGKAQFGINGVPMPTGISGHAALDTGQEMDLLLGTMNSNPDSTMIPFLKQKIENRIANHYSMEAPGIAGDDMRAMADYYHTHVKNAQPSDVSLIAPGKTYEVAINADPEHFLDWDKPLSEQHPKVQQLWAARLPEMKKGPMWAENAGSPQSGADIYNTIASRPRSGVRVYPKDDAAATQALRDAGIPGIKYLDQGSRGDYRIVSKGGDQYGVVKPDGTEYPLSFNKADAQAEVDRQNKYAKTSNYVVFDDKLISIIKKYGLAGLIAGGAAHFKTTPVDHNPFAQQ